MLAGRLQHARLFRVYRHKMAHPPHCIELIADFKALKDREDLNARDIHRLQSSPSATMGSTVAYEDNEHTFVGKLFAHELHTKIFM